MATMTAEQRASAMVEEWYINADESVHITRTARHILADKIAAAITAAAQGALERNRELVESVEALRKHLGNEGEYSICRSDHEVMGWGDTMLIGAVLERISNAIKVVTP